LFITGATGFVGGALALDLLRSQARDRAFCLVRASSDEEAASRLHNALAAAADAYGASSLELHSVLDRAVAVRGDLMTPLLGLSSASVDALAAAAPLHVWHCAASLVDSERRLREIVAHNVAGTERVLETTLDVGTAVFNHMSTAYVAGRTIGEAREELRRPRGFSNRYEQSKHYGEALVRDNCEFAGVPYRILRPGIVIGHSATGRSTGYTGVLGWVLKIAALDEQTGGALHKRPLRYVARADAEINIIPVNSVVEDCIGIDAAGDETLGRVFHLTNTVAPTVGWLCDATSEALGIRPIEIVDSEADLDPLSLKFHQWTRFERPYAQGRKRFDRSDSNGLYPSSRHGYCPISRDTFGRMVRLAVADYRRAPRQQEGVA
jgi:nucleoside-diphosphate-sugar epimerase